MSDRSTSVSRRRFVVAGGAGLGALALGGGAFALVHEGRGRPTGSTTPTSTDGPIDGDGILVVITLYGGNDGLGTVAPVHDGLYRSLRGSLAMDEATALRLPDGMALHPALSKLHARFASGTVAIVQGIGSPDRDRSHFKMQDEWQTGAPERGVGTGWIGRWLDATGTDPLRAIATTPTLPLLLLGQSASGSTLLQSSAAAASDAKKPARADVPTGAMADAWRLLNAPGREGVLGRTTAVGLDLLEVADRTRDAVAAGTTGNLGDAVGGELEAQLGQVATLVRGGLPTRVYAASLGGFDTHAAQADAHRGLLTELDGALEAFFTQLGDEADRVVVLVHSEFGRRVKPNGSLGTDHGRGSIALLLGTRVTGGLVGEPPPLDRLDEGDLTVTTDFRSLYASALELTGLDPEPSLGRGGPKPLVLG